MSFINWHENYVKKSLNMFGLSNYQGFWISFIKGLIFGAITIWFLGCNEQVAEKTSPAPNDSIIALNDQVDKERISNTKTELTTEAKPQFDYAIGVKGNCGMCKTTIEKAVNGLDFVENSEWGIKTKILDIAFTDSVNFDLEELNKAINGSGYETMNSTANQSAYDALPMCCKYDRSMVVYGGPQSKQN